MVELFMMNRDFGRRGWELKENQSVPDSAVDVVKAWPIPRGFNVETVVNTRRRLTAVGKHLRAHGAVSWWNLTEPAKDIAIRDITDDEVRGCFPHDPFHKDEDFKEEFQDGPSEPIDLA